MFVAPFVLLAIPVPHPQQAWPPHPPVFSGYLLGLASDDPILSPDLNGDGHPDLVFQGSDSAHAVSFALGTGAGSFLNNAWPPVSLPEWGYVQSVLADDFDGDGDPDLAVLMDVAGAGRLYGLRNDGSGVLTLYTTMDFQKHGEGLASADVDGDGWVDLFALRDPYPKVTLLRSLGPAGFAAPKWLEPPAGFFGARDYAVGDTTGDGLPDVLCLLSAELPAVFQYANDGAGGFHAPVKVFDVPLSTKRFLMADMRGDGVLHAGAVAGSVSEGFSFFWFENDGNGAFEYRQRLEGVQFPQSGPPLLPVRDLDGDGRQEWVVQRSPGVFVRIVAEGAGVAFAPGDEILLPGSAWVAAGDFDSDGTEDWMTAEGLSGPPELILSPGDGAGGLLGRVQSRSQSGGGEATLVDVDSDGLLDLVSLDQFDKTVHLFRGLGDGRFQWLQSVATEAEALDFAAGDFDGDGRLDLGLLESTYARVELLLQGADGMFTSAGSTPPDPVSTTGYCCPIAVDSDGDGRDELALLAWPEERILLVGLGGASRTEVLGAVHIAGVQGLHGVTDAPPGAPQAIEFIAPGTTAHLALWVLAQPLSPTQMTLSERLPLPLPDPGASGADIHSAVIEVRDQDGDGLRDVWSIHQYFDGSYSIGVCASVWSGLPSGGFSAPASERAYQTLIPLQADDFDGDGFTDYAYQYYYWYGWFGSPTHLQIHRPALGMQLAQPEAYAWYTRGLGDVDGDGRVDLVIARDAAIISVLNLSAR